MCHSYEGFARSYLVQMFGFQTASIDQWRYYTSTSSLWLICDVVTLNSRPSFPPHSLWMCATCEPLYGIWGADNHCISIILPEFIIFRFPYASAYVGNEIRANKSMHFRLIALLRFFRRPFVNHAVVIRLSFRSCPMARILSAGWAVG